ncbi:MAG: AmmeMemoRadiSam system protein B [Marinilabiliaceae bacterium]|nr:AmmeMemoRadiSam system protein B [Marinilabiliaceae bacterium]
MEEFFIRKPVVAGRFYEGNKVVLGEQVRNMIDTAPLSDQTNRVLALIVPHAGYVFSGEVAAAAYKQLGSECQIKNVFLVGSSHRVAFEGASVYEKGHYQTPLGEVEINNDITRQLINESQFINFREEAHNAEHCLEVQLPFLQVQLGAGFKIIPIILGTHDINECRSVANVLKPYFQPGNLFVISTDFSHYPGYDDAVKEDHLTAEVILKNDPLLLSERLQDLKESAPEGLVTGLCGWTSVITLLYITAEQSNVSFEHLVYRNSGDVSLGDKNGVVGYHAIAIRDLQSDSFQLSDSDKETILCLVENELRDCFGLEQKPVDDTISVLKQTQAGAFVSIYNENKLRGCLGRFGSSSPLGHIIKEMAYAAATRDQRFEPIKKEEFPNLRYEISVLTPHRKIKSIDEIILGKHGIYVEKDERHGVFLPQVAVKTGWTVEEYLGHCAKDKAHMGWDGWRDADIYVFEAIIISNKDQ